MLILKINFCDAYDGCNGDSFYIIQVINYRHDWLEKGS